MAVRLALGVRTFCEQILEDHHVEGLIGDELLEFAVFLFHEAEAFGVADFEPAEFMPPLVEGRLADAVAATEFRDGCASLMFFEGLDDLFFGVSCFHVECCAASAAHSQLSSGLKGSGLLCRNGGGW